MFNSIIGARRRYLRQRYRGGVRRSLPLQETLRASLAPLLFTGVIFALPASGQVGEPKSPHALHGKLLILERTGPIVRTAKRDYQLSARTTYLLHTLQDKRLLNREVHLEGTLKPDGTLEVVKLYTIRNGQLYRVRYFCETCNIEALEPGACVCCQQPTELQEIPVSPTNN